PPRLRGPARCWVGLPCGQLSIGWWSGASRVCAVSWRWSAGAHAEGSARLTIKVSSTRELTPSFAKMLKAMIRMLAVASAGWNDDVWVIDSTPRERGRSRPTAKRSDTPGWAGYGYSASHSPSFWGWR